MRKYLMRLNKTYRILSLVRVGSRTCRRAALGGSPSTLILNKDENILLAITDFNKIVYSRYSGRM